MSSNGQDPEARADRREEAASLLWDHGVGAFSGSETACRCDRKWRSNANYQAHLADALLPLIARFEREAAAKGWDDGHSVGWEHCQDGNYGTDYWDDDTANPYRAAALTDSEAQS